MPHLVERGASSGGGKARILFLPLLLANLALLSLAFYCYRTVQSLESRVVGLEQQMTDRPITRITLPDGRVRTTFRRDGESAAAYAARVLELANAATPEHHLCTTLTGCQPGGTTEIEHCTPYNGSTPSAAVIAQHEADVAALCDAFECTDCGH